MSGSLRGSSGGVKQHLRQNRDRPIFSHTPPPKRFRRVLVATTRRSRKTRILLTFPHGSTWPMTKKQKNLHKRSCRFSAIRIDHGHRRGGHDPVSERAISSVGRAPRLHRGCREFESLIAHHFSSLHPKVSWRPSCRLAVLRQCAFPTAANEKTDGTFRHRPSNVSCGGRPSGRPLSRINPARARSPYPCPYR